MTFHSADLLRARMIFDTAVARIGAARTDFVTAACGSDEVLRTQVEALLASHESGDTFLEQPPPLVAAPPSATDHMIGQTTAGYRVLSRLGAGGMGEVYLAHDDKLDRPVALKLLSSHVHSDPSHLRRFHQEAKAASSLNHPHILVIHDFGEIDGRPFMVTEYVEGRTLWDRLRDGPLRIVEALDIGIQIASALAAAHARGIIHRDVKPENVMVRPDGYVKVLDFGLAEAVTGPGAVASTLTQPGMVLGTPRYMSPEQARGHALDARSDVWSLGVVLHEMITGTSPFGGHTLAEVLAAILEHPPASLPDAPPALAACISRALSKDPSARYTSAGEMHAALVTLKDYDSPASAHFHTIRLAATPKRARRTIDSIAVLPLATSSSDSELEYLADGITESVIIALSQLPKLRVMARSTVFRYKGGDQDPRAIGRELGVRAVLAGRLRVVGDRFLIAAELVDAADGSQIWGGQLQSRLRARLRAEFGSRAGPPPFRAAALRPRASRRGDPRDLARARARPIVADHQHRGRPRPPLLAPLRGGN